MANSSASTEIAPVSPQEERGGAEQGVELTTGNGIYPEYDNPYADLLSEKAQARYYGTAMSVQEFNRSRLSFDQKNIVRGHVPLVDPLDTGDRVQFLPSYDLATVYDKEIQKPDGVGPENSYSGRISETHVIIRGESTNIVGGTDPNGSNVEVFSTHDSAFTNGRVWMESEVRKSLAAGEYNPLSGRSGLGLAGMVGIFLLDSRTHFPLADIPELEHMHDRTLVSVISSNCINARDMLIDYPQEVNMPDGSSKIVQTTGMLSELLENERANFRNSIGGSDEHFRQVVQGMIGGYGMVYERLESLAMDKDTPAIDFDEDVWRPVTTKLNAQLGARNAIVEEMERQRGFTDNDMYALRIPARAAYQLRGLDKFLKTYPIQTPEARARVAKRKGNIVKEFVEAITMDMHVKKLETVVAHHEFNPIRMEFSGIDSFDTTWAACLSKVRKGNPDIVESSQLTARRYMQMGQAGVTFVMDAVDANRGNQLVHTTDARRLHQWNSFQGFSDKSMYYQSRMTMPHKSNGGAFPGEIVRSVYDPSMPLYMPGIIGRFVVNGRGMRNPIEGIAVDLMEAPAAVAKRVVDLGLLESNENGIPGRTTFSSIFTDQINSGSDREIIITRRHIDPESGIPHLRVEKTLKNGEVAQIVRNSDMTEVVIKSTKEGILLEDQKEEFEKEHRQNLEQRLTSIPRRQRKIFERESRASVRDRINALRGTYEVITTRRQPDTEFTVGGIALARNVPNVLVTSDNRRDAKTFVMPSENRANAKAAHRMEVAAAAEREAEESGVA